MLLFLLTMKQRAAGLGLCVGLLLLLPLRLSAQDLMGVRPGMAFEEVEGVLSAQGLTGIRVDNEATWKTEYDTERGILAVSADQSDFSSRSAAHVQGVTLSAVRESVSQESLRTLADELRSQWNKRFGVATPSHYGSVVSHEWNGESVTATLTYSTLDGAMHTVEVRLSER